MPFREKAKALFKTKSRSDSLSKSSSKDSSGGRERWPSNVYKPGEAMPRPKYRRPPEKAHKEKLESFSFADAWRRKSFQSTYSPGGTRAPSRAPSRRNSIFSLGRKSRSSRANSLTSADGEKGGVRQREGGGFGAAVAPGLSTEAEAEGDDDVANVGLSRVQSREKPILSRPRTAEDPPQPPPIAGPFRTMNTAHDHQPFTEQELTLALQRSHLAVPTR